MCWKSGKERRGITIRERERDQWLKVESGGNVQCFVLDANWSTAKPETSNKTHRKAPNSLLTQRTIVCDSVQRHHHEDGNGWRDVSFAEPGGAPLQGTVPGDHACRVE
jgi:hypothetical protein